VTVTNVLTPGLSATLVVERVSQFDCAARVAVVAAPVVDKASVMLLLLPCATVKLRDAGFEVTLLVFGLPPMVS
jgi:hypothetical protein